MSIPDRDHQPFGWLRPGYGNMFMKQEKFRQLSPKDNKKYLYGAKIPN